MGINPNDISAGDNDTYPGTPDPLSPGRTDINPSGDKGYDELPDNDGKTPLDEDNEAGDQSKVPDQDPDNAEMDGESNPR
jgi:hypothetical protein